MEPKTNLVPQDKKVSILPKFNENALDDAQGIAFEAWSASSQQKRITLAKKALRISPYCTDAYNILAESSQKLEECIALYAQGVDVAKKAFGKRFFKEYEGVFWGMMETRPFMRAMEGLADCLWEAGERSKAIATYQEMLRLNPNDNQGVRYLLINWLIAESEFEAAEKLLSDYRNDCALMLFSAALLYFKQARKVKARNALKKAMESNPHMPEYLLNPNKKYIPESKAEKMFGGYQLGHPSEAEEYRSLAGDTWRETPGALEWLRESLS